MSERTSGQMLVEPPPSGGLYNYTVGMQHALRTMPLDAHYTHYTLGNRDQDGLLADQPVWPDSELTRVTLYRGHEVGEATVTPTYNTTVYVGQGIAEAYCRLDSYDSHRLAQATVRAMSRAAVHAYGFMGELGEEGACDATGASCHDEYRGMALMNNQPIIIEPRNHSMLVGRWLDRQGKPTRYIGERHQLIVEGSDSTTPEQRCVLLGGLAAFLTYLDR